jgi:hypothetical protein
VRNVQSASPLEYNFKDSVFAANCRVNGSHPRPREASKLGRRELLLLYVSLSCLCFAAMSRQSISAAGRPQDQRRPSGSHRQWLECTKLVALLASGLRLAPSTRLDKGRVERESTMQRLHRGRGIRREANPRKRAMRADVSMEGVTWQHGLGAHGPAR